MMIGNEIKVQEGDQGIFHKIFAFGFGLKTSVPVFLGSRIHFHSTSILKRSQVTRTDYSLSIRSESSLALGVWTIL